MNIPETLKQLREKSGLSQAQVAKAMGYKLANNYVQYECGECVPSIKKLEQILKAMGYELTLLILPASLSSEQISAIDSILGVE